MQPPAILNVSHNYFVAGGSDRYFIDHCRLLQQHGHAVIPFCAEDSRNRSTEFDRYFPASPDFENPGIVDLYRHIYSGPARKAITTLLNREHVDLAHLHIYYGKLTASILQPLREQGIPVVQTLHEYKLICPVYTMVSQGHTCEVCSGRHFWQALPRRCNRGKLDRTLLSVIESYVSKNLGAVRSVDHFVAVSNFMREKMVQHGVAPEKITTVHNFVDADCFEPTYDEGRYVLYFGRLEELKGIYTLLSAMTVLPGVQCLIAGEGEERAAIEQYIKLNRLENVKVLGFVRGDALHDMIRGAVCTVLPSLWYEPFGLTVLESFALGRPAIGSRIGGVSELIDHGIDGFLFEPGNAEELTGFIEVLAADRNRTVEMGKAGRHKVLSQFSTESHYQGLLRVYDQLLAVNKP